MSKVLGAAAVVRDRFFGVQFNLLPKSGQSGKRLSGSKGTGLALHTQMFPPSLVVTGRV
jgi:hypothetical protein